MEMSLYLAQLLGPILVLYGLAFSFRFNRMEEMVKDFTKNSGLVYISSMIMVTIGMVMILAHNVWEWSWAVIPTILGWAILLKGAMFAFIPEPLFKLSNKIMKVKGIFVVAIFVWLLAGLCLTYYGYFA